MIHAHILSFNIYQDELAKVQNSESVFASSKITKLYRNYLVDVIIGKKKPTDVFDPSTQKTRRI